MTHESEALLSTAQSLTDAFLLNYPQKAARVLEKQPADDAAKVLSHAPVHVVKSIWRYLAPGAADAIATDMDEGFLAELLQLLDTHLGVALLSRLDAEKRKRILVVMQHASPGHANELTELLNYPESAAGRFMDARVQTFHEQITAAEAIRQIKYRKAGSIDQFYLTDANHRPTGVVSAGELLLLSDEDKLIKIAKPIRQVVYTLDSKDDVFEKLQSNRDELPVLDANEQLAGAIKAVNMQQQVKEDLVANLQTMVGASKDEKALSSFYFAFTKRMPWLQINLLTAFLAAAVVGIFQDLIAQHTALAILLPVAAGQSGNAGAQAQAVTMRGLTLREISTRQWPQVLWKEMRTGLANGVAIAVTCGIGVWWWSESSGLAMVMVLAMILSLTIACSAGALVPVVLKKLGQDPAQSSSIVLTTITDIAGFASFLGIALLFSGSLPVG